MRNPPSIRTRNIGLALVLSKLGYCSRSRAGELIRSGRVRLNGKVECDPETPARLETCTVEVDGKRVNRSEFVYFVLNKPRGAVTTASDERGRRTVYEFLPEGSQWLAPVGRLDQASEGLLLFTNDSEWAAAITAPGSHVVKTYHVQIAQRASDDLLNALTKGVRTATAGLLRAKSAKMLRHGKRNCWLEIQLDEGRNRHIRRMFDALGIEVLRLVRVAIGPLQLGILKKGCVRPLTAAEKLELDPHPKAAKF